MSITFSSNDITASQRKAVLNLIRLTNKRAETKAQLENARNHLQGIMLNQANLTQDTLTVLMLNPQDNQLTSTEINREDFENSQIADAKRFIDSAEKAIKKVTPKIRATKKRLKLLGIKSDTDLYQKLKALRRATHQAYLRYLDFCEAQDCTTVMNRPNPPKTFKKFLQGSRSIHQDALSVYDKKETQGRLVDFQRQLLVIDQYKSRIFSLIKARKHFKAATRQQPT